MAHMPAQTSLLGKSSAYADRRRLFSLLFPIRAGKRAEIGITGALLPGADLWTAFELSWLNERGKPQVALAHFTVPAGPNIVESKSFKLYLNTSTTPVGRRAGCAGVCAPTSASRWRGRAPSHRGVPVLPKC